MNSEHPLWTDIGFFSYKKYKMLVVVFVNVANVFKLKVKFEITTRDVVLRLPRLSMRKNVFVPVQKFKIAYCRFKNISNIINTNRILHLQSVALYCD